MKQFIIAICIGCTFFAACSSTQNAITTSGEAPSWADQAPSVAVTDSSYEAFGVSAAIDSSFAVYQAGSFANAMLKKHVRTELSELSEKLDQEVKNMKFAASLNSVVNNVGTNSTVVAQQSTRDGEIHTSYAKRSVSFEVVTKLVSDTFGSDHPLTVLIKNQGMS